MAYQYSIDDPAKNNKRLAAFALVVLIHVLFVYVLASGLGKKVVEDVDEYRKRSPVFWAAKLKTPLLIHATTNDRDVNVLETENLVNALKAEGKKFEVRIYKDAPAGHSFNRIDTPFAKESRREIWDFLEKHLGK